MKVNGCGINLNYNNPGFTLPNTIGELGDITTLDLSYCSLRGTLPHAIVFESRDGLKPLCTQLMRAFVR